jgi:predicted GNAT family acetyltransferase
LSDQVRQNLARNRFELDVEGETAIAVYRPAPGVLTFTHTEVPVHLQGRGIASKLMRGALTAVRAQGLKIVASCPFVGAYVGKHPEFQDLLL